MVRHYFFSGLAALLMFSAASAYAGPVELARNAATQQQYYGGDYMQCLTFARSQAATVQEPVREQATGEFLNNCMYSKGWSNFAPAEPATPAPTTPKPKIAAQPPTPARPVPVQPAVPMQAAPVASGGGFYGPDYMACLKVARYRSQFVHESMREEALGELLNECMFARGYSNFAPVEEENPNADLFLYYNN